MVYCPSDLNGKCKMQAPCVHVCTLQTVRQILQPQKCATQPAPQAQVNPCKDFAPSKKTDGMATWIRHARPTVCEGSCDTHDGEHRLVRVVDQKTGFDWGLFWYCDEAIRIDKSNGLCVDEPNTN